MLLAHQFVTGKDADPETAGSENQAAEAVGTLEKVGWDAFDAFDYVALGHIHSPQSVGRREVRYSGSPLKYSLSEVLKAKSVPLVTLGEKGQVDIELLPLVPLRDMRHIKGRLEDLTRESLASEDYIYATLTDEDVIPDAIGHLRAYYPNIMKLDYANSHTRELMEFSFDDKAEKIGFTELLGDLYQKVLGGTPSEEEWTVLKETAGEAGIIYETD